MGWSFFVPLLLLLFLTAVTTPTPLWVGRALRGRDRRLALPPGRAEASRRAGLGDAVSRLAQDAEILGMLLPGAIEVVDDMKAARLAMHFMVGMRRDQDNWASDLVTRYYQEVGDAQRLFHEWVEAVKRLPPATIQELERRGFAPARPTMDSTAEVLRVGTTLISSVPTRAELVRTRDELSGSFGQVSAFLEALARPGDPYR